MIAERGRGVDPTPMIRFFMPNRPQTALRGGPIVAVAALLVCLPVVAATPPAAAPAAPSEPIAVGRFDPSGFRSAALWLNQLFTLLDAAQLMPAPEAVAADAILAATVLGALPHEAALYELRIVWERPGIVRVERFQLAIAIDAPGRHEQLKQTLATIVHHYASHGTRLQRSIERPDGRQLVRFRDASWPAWLELEWSADAQHFYLGLGAGALERWFDQSDPIETDPRIERHRKARAANHATNHERRPFLDLFVDAERLRQEAAPLFHGRRSADLVRLLGATRTDQFMLHGAMAGTFAVLELTALENGGIGHRALTLDHWPQDAGLPRPEASFHAVAPVDWDAASGWLRRFVLAAMTLQEQRQFNHYLAHYVRQTGLDPWSYLAQHRPYLLLGTFPRPWLPIPGATTMYLVPKQAVDQDAAASQFDALMRPLAAAAGSRGRDLGVAHDPKTGVWWLDTPLRGLVKAPAWGWAGGSAPVFICSFSPKAVLSNRQWLQTHARPRLEAPTAPVQALGQQPATQARTSNIEH